MFVLYVLQLQAVKCLMIAPCQTAFGIPSAGECMQLLSREHQKRTLNNRAWFEARAVCNVCRDYGLGVGDTCKGTCKYASAAISEDFLDNPYLFCGQNGIEIRNAGLCLPP
jgi:hypothetical protein